MHNKELKIWSESTFNDPQRLLSRQLDACRQPNQFAVGHSLPHLQEPPFHFLHFVFLQPFFLSTRKLEAPGDESILSAVEMRNER